MYEPIVSGGIPSTDVPHRVETEVLPMPNVDSGYVRVRQSIVGLSTLPVITYMTRGEALELAHQLIEAVQFIHANRPD